MGITFTRDFKFRSHIYKIAQKANNVLGIIKHTVQSNYNFPHVFCLTRVSAWTEK